MASSPSSSCPSSPPSPAEVPPLPPAITLKEAESNHPGDDPSLLKCIASQLSAMTALLAMGSSAATTAEDMVPWVMKASMLLPSVSPDVSAFEWMSEVMTTGRPQGSWRGVIEEVSL